MLPKDFAKKIKDAIAKNERLFSESSAEALTYVSALRKDVRDALVMSKGFETVHLTKINKEIDAAVLRLQNKLTTAVKSNQDKAFVLGGSGIADALKLSVGVSLPVLPDVLLATIKDYSADLIKDLSAELVDKISADIRRGVLLGENPYETMERVEQHLFQDGEGAFFRAETIVRTENARAFEIANQERMAQAAKEIPKLKKQWVASDDERTRDSHTQAGIDYGVDGTPGPIPVAEPFIVGGEELMFPGDPEGDPHQVINCRCVSVPYVDDWEKDVVDEVAVEESLREGGQGSGNFDHLGRPGEVGGSSESGDAAVKNTDFDTAHKEYLGQLSVADKRVIQEYTNKDYRRINIAMRREKFADADMRQRAERLTELIKNAPPLDKDVYVYRGISKSLQSMGVVENSEFIDKAFVSTSLNNKLDTFNDMNTFMRIKIPAGTRALFVESISKVKGEQELLLGPGSKFKINTIAHGGSGGPMYKVSATLI